MEKDNKIPRRDDRVPGVFVGKGKYIDDYSLEEYTDGKGRVKKRTHYNGSWFCVKGDEARARRRLFLSLTLALILGAALIAVQVQTHTSAWAFYVILPQAVALFPLLYLALGLFKLPYRLRPMERGSYFMGIIRVCRSSVAILILCAASFIGDFVFRGLSGDWVYLHADRLYLVLLGLVLLCCGAILWLLNGIEIDERPNHAYPQPKNR